MPSINVLSKEIAELIAAGEVIERPASVIKELVENSIDSLANNITVEIKNGGTTYMRVTDDGCGMSFEDVPTAFLRHATSKVASRADLDNIYTLGFRGEALASISAVSKVEVMTKPKNDTYGTIYKIEGSQEVMHEKGGCPDGTTIIIRDLFYNVPARRKFMKKDVTEANAISQILQKIALSHPSAAIRFIRDNRMEFGSCGDDSLYSVIYSVYGRDFAGGLIPVEYTYHGIDVKGYVAKPLYSKSNRSFQNFFINGRYVRSRLCSSALESAFINMVMTGKFPACILMLDLVPSAVDVNIHPAKAEVRFTNEKDVTDAIYFAVRNALMNDGLIYEFDIHSKTDWTKEGAEPPHEEITQQEFMFTPVDKINETEAAMRRQEEISAHGNNLSHEKDVLPDSAVSEESAERESEFNFESEAAAPENPDSNEKTEMISENVHESESAQTRQIPQEPFRYINSSSFAQPQIARNNENTAQTANNPYQRQTAQELPEIRVIGEAFKNYVIAEAGDKLIMIDKHAAHERIIFERLKGRNCRQYSQILMTKIKVLLPLNEFDALQNNQELLADMGFSFDFSEPPFAAATAVPTFLTELNLDEVVSEIAENLYLNKQNPQTHVLDDMLHTIACKSAIKANDKNTLGELQALAEQVYYDDRIRHCPHGRPVMFIMTKGNIEHQFRRT